MSILKTQTTAPTVFLYSYVIVTQIASGLYFAAELQPSPVLTVMGPIGMIWAITSWLQRDFHSRQIQWTIDAGFFVYIGWLFLLPYYLLKTRGARGLLLMLAFVAVYFVSTIVGAAIFILFTPTL